jgi:hypothetical protein
MGAGNRGRIKTLSWALIAADVTSRFQGVVANVYA